jgi:hypothetical protein
MGRLVEYYLVKINRLAGWLLLVAVIMYLCTGLATCGEFGFSKLISSRNAVVVHRRMLWPMLICFVPHAGLSVYFAMRRWGWIGRKA